MSRIQHPKTTPRTMVRITAIAAGLLASGIALADADMDPQLESLMAAAAPVDELQVVISYKHSGPPSAVDVAELQALGITKGITMRSLPIAGALATPAEIEALATDDDVASIYWNAPIQYLDEEANGLSGAAATTGRPGDYGRAIPFSGAGVTVEINDSGIDATHDDLNFGNHVVQNTQGVTNLAAYDSMLPITYIEGIPNTDWGSGHGTHCAGIVGGTGAKSNGLYRGVAPGADLVGYGSGAVLLILDAVGGLDYAATNQFSYDNPIRVVSNSWGSSGKFDPLDPVSIASYELYKLGIISVFAAGNAGPGEDTHNPYAQAPWVISVGASEKDGVLTSFSSRGKRGEMGTFTMPDGEEWTYFNEPTIVAPGVDIISTRDLAGALPPLEAQHDAETIDPAYLPFYTHMSGTSMATPHVAGIVALILEANPDLTPTQVKDIIERTATNMTGRQPWEVGAGHINAYAAVAEAAGLRYDFGATVNSLNAFNSNAFLVPGADPVPFSIFFTPVGEVESQSFEVGAEVAYVSARADIGDNTVAIVLTDPDGNRYGSAISLPVLGETVVAGGPGNAGTWTITVRGIGSVSGNDVDPADVTNGYGAPGTVTGEVSFLNSGGYTGLDDIAGHPAQKAIEFAVAKRLVDGYSDHRFRPDQPIKRKELAKYLLMGASVRQYLPFDHNGSFSDMGTNNPYYAFAESAVATGAPLRDLSQSDNGVMRMVNGQFMPNQRVTRVNLAYSLVQSLALQDQALAFSSANQSETFTGTMGPSVENSEVDEYQIQIGSDVTTINANLSWDAGAVDLDLYLVDPDGNEVASAASTDNPEMLQYAVTQSGTYTYRVTGYTSVTSSYTLVSTQDMTGTNPGTVTAFYDGERIPVEDVAQMPPVLRGYVQLALDLDLINARFTVTQGPYDLEPTLHAYFDPDNTVTRAAYAVAAGRYLTYYQSAED